MPTITESPHIKDVLHVQLEAFSDRRGRFIEIFRKEWFPQVEWNALQSNHTESEAGVLRGLHFHHHQVDYWYVISGSIRAGLVDLRASSPTHMEAVSVDLHQDMGMGIFIPIGVAHGFYVLEKATILYFVDNYYDGQDEYGIMWNDEEINMDWGVNHPVLSNRDQINPRLRDLPKSVLPE